MNIAKRFLNLKPQISLDTEALHRYNDVIDLSIGDTDLITPTPVINRAFEDAKKGYTKYGDPKGDPQLISTIQDYYEEEYNQTVDKSNILVTTSSCMGMALVMFSLLDPDDEVIVFAPYFSVYKQQIEFAGGKCVEVDTYLQDNWQFKKENIEKAITSKTKAIIVNNPVNPTGAFYDVDSLQMIVDIANMYNLTIIADEIYTDFVYDRKFTPFISLMGLADNLITLNSFSKNYMMTGWRVGYIVADPLLCSVMQSINSAMVYTTPSISQRAAIAAIENRKSIRENYCNVYKQRMEYAYERIKNIPYLSVAKSSYTFYLFICIKATKMSSKEFSDYILNNCHILCTPGSAFGSCGEGFVRFALTQDMELIKEAFDRLEKLCFA